MEETEVRSVMDNQGTEPIIRLENVSKVYQMGRVEVPALRGVDLTIWPGELTAIVGASGSGKSTLMNVIGCLDLPTEGTYHLRDRDVTTYNDRQLSKLRGDGIGFVFQSYSLLTQYSALHNVQVPRYYATGRGDSRRAKELLAQVGLADRARHKPTELSGGEQQRVAVARALMNDPFLVLADEPTGNLDSASGQEVMDLLKELNRERGLTVLVVSHDPEVSSQARRVITLEDFPTLAERVARSPRRTRLTDISFYEARAQFEKEYLQALLQRCKYNISAASRMGEISRKSLHTKAVKYGLIEATEKTKEKVREAEPVLA